MKKIIIFLFLLLFSLNSVLADDNLYYLDLERDNLQYLEISDASQTGLDLGVGGTDFTISFWFNPESLPATYTNQGFISRTPGAGEDSFYLNWRNINNGSMRFLSSSDGSNVSISDISFSSTIGTWQHMTVTYDASEGIFETFKNGVSVGSASGLTTSLYDSSGRLQIGSLGSGTNTLDAKIDEFAIFSEIRSDEDILNTYDCGLNGEEDNIVALWNFDNQDGGDLTSNNNDLTIYNSPVFSNSDLPFTDSCYEEEEEEETATTTQTLYALDCTPNYTNDISMINACSFTSSTTNATYTNYHIPFFIYLIILIPFLFVADRLIVEYVIRLREK